NVKSDIQGSAEASFLGFGGKANANVSNQTIQDVTNKFDGEVQWSGQKLIPASLNVMVLRSGAQNQSIQLQSDESVVFGTQLGSGEQRVSILRTDSGGPWVSMPIGAVVPFFVSPDQLANMAPFWLPADGRTVSDAYSPLNGRTLPNMTGRFPLGSDATKNVT